MKEQSKIKEAVANNTVIHSGINLTQDGSDLNIRPIPKNAVNSLNDKELYVYDTNRVSFSAAFFILEKVFGYSKDQVFNIGIEANAHGKALVFRGEIGLINEARGNISICSEHVMKNNRYLMPEELKFEIL